MRKSAKASKPKPLNVGVRTTYFGKGSQNYILPMEVKTYLELKEKIIELGFEEEISWAESVKDCKSALDFAREHSFVVCNSGLKAQIAVKIFYKCWQALINDIPIDDSIFRNKPKRAAMQLVFDDRERLFQEYNAADDKLAYLETLPYIGAIIKYHLAKNLGMDFCKPDRHLVRIAKNYETTPEAMCQSLADATGDRIGTVDLVIWRAANLGRI